MVCKCLDHILKTRTVPEWPWRSFHSETLHIVKHQTCVSKEILQKQCRGTVKAAVEGLFLLHYTVKSINIIVITAGQIQFKWKEHVREEALDLWLTFDAQSKEIALYFVTRCYFSMIMNRTQIVFVGLKTSPSASLCSVPISLQLCFGCFGVCWL